MVEPMLLPGGHSVEKLALQQWIAHHHGILRNPVTNVIENANEVKPNVPLQTFISAFNLTPVPAARHFPDPASDMGGGKPRKITRHRRRRHKMKRTTKKRHSKKSKRVQK